MAETPTRWEKWKQRLQDRWRLVIFHEESLSEFGSYRLTLLNLYIMFSVLFVLISTLVVLVIMFTPVKQWIPGYGEITSNKAYLEIRNRLAELEEEVAAQDKYNEALRRVLSGNPQSSEEVERDPPADTIAIINTVRIEEDDILRQDLEMKEKLSQLNDDERDQEVMPEQMYFVPPIDGEMALAFDEELQHFGIDVVASKDAPVKSVMDGVVIFSEWSEESGNTIAIMHDNHLISFYKHNSSLLKKMHDPVKAGEAIAIIGNTGMHTSGPHLHFELWHKGKALDPAQYIDF